MIEVPYGTGIPPLGIHPKEPKPIDNRHTCTPIFTTALFAKSKLGKQSTRPPTNEWIMKMCHIYMPRRYQV
jgi:hypothetical protein